MSWPATWARPGGGHAGARIAGAGFALNIAFPAPGAGGDRLNADIVVTSKNRAWSRPHLTTPGGQLAIRAAIVNHRTTQLDIDALDRGGPYTGAAHLSLYGEEQTGVKSDGPCLQSQLLRPSSASRAQRIAFAARPHADGGMQLIARASADATDANALPSTWPLCFAAREHGVRPRASSQRARAATELSDSASAGPPAAARLHGARRLDDQHGPADAARRGHRPRNALRGAHRLPHRFPADDVAFNAIGECEPARHALRSCKSGSKPGRAPR